MSKGDCVIIIANDLVTEILPTENFRTKVIFIEPGFMEACTPHTSYGIVGGMTMFINPVMHLDERDQWLCEHDFDEIIRRIRKPYLVITGEQAFTRPVAELMYQNAASEVKELHVIPGALHFEMYDHASSRVH